MDNNGNPEHWWEWVFVVMRGVVIFLGVYILFLAALRFVLTPIVKFVWSLR